MFRHLSKLNVLVLVLVSLLFGGVLRFALTSKAATTIPVTRYCCYNGMHFMTTDINEDTSSYPTEEGTSFYSISPQDAGAVPVYRRRNPSNGGHIWSLNSNEGASAYTAYEGIAFYAYASQVSGSVPIIRFRKGADYVYTFSSSEMSSLATLQYVREGPAFYALPGESVAPEPPASGDNSGGDSGSSGYDSYDYSTPDATPAETAVADTEAPTAPDGLDGSFDKESNSIPLTWTEATDDTAVAGYQVQRQEKDSDSWTQVGEVTSAQFTDFKFAGGKTYEYQVRAYDAAKNYSEWSLSKEITSGDFVANVTVNEGGTVTDDAKLVSVDIPKNAVTEDIVLLVSKVNIKGLSLPKNSKTVGGYYNIQAKNSKGEEIKKFNRQITIKFNYGKLSTFGATKSSLHIATAEDGKDVTVLKTSLDGTEATTLSDHLSVYFLVAEKTGVWVTLLWIFFWLVLIGGLGFAGYYGWQRYSLSRYQEEHAEDFIYKH